MVNVRVLKSGGYEELPKYATPGSAGLDLRSTKTVVLKPHGRALVPTGLYIALPEGYEAQIRPRSGLALKKGITVLNSPGTVDADYRNEVGVILFNTTDELIMIEKGDRVAQMVINKVEQLNWVEVEELDETERKDGFGHTGLK